MIKVLCKTCKFHEAQPSPGRDGAGNAVPVGFCHRYPPQVVQSAVSSFPVVGSDTNWCGEHIPSLKVKAAEARDRAQQKKGK